MIKAIFSSEFGFKYIGSVIEIFCEFWLFGKLRGSLYISTVPDDFSLGLISGLYLVAL